MKWERAQTGGSVESTFVALGSNYLGLCNTAFAAPAPPVSASLAAVYCCPELCEQTAFLKESSLEPYPLALSKAWLWPLSSSTALS